MQIREMILHGDILSSLPTLIVSTFVNSLADFHIFSRNF